MRLGLNKYPVGLRPQLKMSTYLNKREKEIIVIKRILWFLWKIYLPDTTYSYFFILFNKGPGSIKRLCPIKWPVPKRAFVISAQNV